MWKYVRWFKLTSLLASSFSESKSDLSWSKWQKGFGIIPPTQPPNKNKRPSMHKQWVAEPIGVSWQLCGWKLAAHRLEKMMNDTFVKAHMGGTWTIPLAGRFHVDGMPGSTVPFFQIPNRW